MSLFIASLNSGSNGNCYYIGNHREAVLVDTGISLRMTEKRMHQLSLDIARVKAIFISHEHADHVTGLPGISKKYQIPVYITPLTLAASRLPVEPHLVQHFSPHEPVVVGEELRVTPFPKFHDAADPHSFVVSSGETTVGVLTDIGEACSQVTHYFSQCHAAFLESNYCEDMLEKGRYPYVLRQRISGREGHLSNTQALALLRGHRHPQLSHLVLAHLSANNNRRELVESLFLAEAGPARITVASRFGVSGVFEVKSGMVGARPSAGQMSLFE